MFFFLGESHFCSVSLSREVTGRVLVRRVPFSLTGKFLRVSPLCFIVSYVSLFRTDDLDVFGVFPFRS